MIVALIAGTVLSVEQTDKWELKAATAAKTSYAAEMNILATAGGQDLDVLAGWKLTFGETKDAKTAAVMEFTKVIVNGEEQTIDESDRWDITVGSRGEVSGTQSEWGNSLRRMFAPVLLIYPNKAVGVGDKWSHTLDATKEGDAPKATFNYLVEALETADTGVLMKIKYDLLEAGEGGTKANGFFWVNKTGKVVKFETTITGWHVPMAGGANLDAQIKGTSKG